MASEPPTIDPKDIPPPGAASLFGDHHRATRGDQIEAYIKRFRDKFPKVSDEWAALDYLLDDYRLHADTGTSLDMEVEENG